MSISCWCWVVSMRGMIGPVSALLRIGSSPAAAWGWTGGSGAHEPADGLGSLGELGLAVLAGGLTDAVAEVVIEEQQGDRLQRLGGRADLGEHVDAVRLVLDLTLQSAHLAL